MSTPGSPTVRRRRLAAELRRLRAQSGENAASIAAALGWSKAKISRYELARGGLKPSEVERLLDVYGVQGEQRQRLLAIAEEADSAQKGWWESYSDILTPEYLSFIALEAEATSILQWQISVVPGLLQTERYARQIYAGYQRVRTAPETIVNRRVQTRIIRQRLLTRDPPIDLAVVIDESVLLRQWGDRDVMHEQLQHLVDISQLANVTLRVLPLQGPKELSLDNFVILQFGPAHETQLHDVVSTEGLGTYLYVEGETDTHQYRIAFKQLVDEALEPERSAERILQINREVWS